jgi:hypothetical protein
VESLDGELAVVEFEEEVDQLVVGDSAVAVGVVPEDVCDNVEDVEVVGLEEGLEDVDDLAFLEGQVLVQVKLLQQQEEVGASSSCEVVVRELVGAHNSRGHCCGRNGRYIVRFFELWRLEVLSFRQTIIICFQIVV